MNDPTPSYSPLKPILMPAKTNIVPFISNLNTDQTQVSLAPSPLAPSTKGKKKKGKKGKKKKSKLENYFAEKEGFLIQGLPTVNEADESTIENDYGLAPA